MESNDIAVRPAKSQQQTVTINSTARRAIALRFPPTSTTVWPGEFLEVDLLGDAPSDSMYGFELRTDASSIRNLKLTASQLWPQPTWSPASWENMHSQLTVTPEPHFVKWNEHFCQVHVYSFPAKYPLNSGNMFYPGLKTTTFILKH